MDPAALAQRIGGARVGLRRDLTVSRHMVAGDPSYVFHDPVAFRNHAFTTQEYQVLTAIRADRNLSVVFAGLVKRKVLESSEEEDFFSFVIILHGFGLLRLPLSESGRLFDRYQLKKQAKRKALWMAPIYLRMPLWDPDKFLGRTMRFVKPLFSKAGVMAWIALWLVVTWNLLGRGSELVAEASGMLTLSNVPVMYVALVVLKVIHELGHAYCCKRFGVEVPEIGLAFIVATPCAYVDASASWKLPSRLQRIAVGLAGMYFELAVAAVSALVWVGTAPGFTHMVALSIFVLSSVTTLLFNINPLMRFDGYYVFADLVGVTNLRDRSARFLRQAARSIIVGIGEPPAARQWCWLLSYGIGSAIYRVVLAFSVVAMMLVVWPMAGLVLGLFFGFMMIVLPLCKMFYWLWSHEDSQPQRARARLVAVTLIVLAPLALGWLPVSRSLVIHGVLELEHREILRAPSDGFVTDVLCSQGQELSADQSIVVIANKQLQLETELIAEQLHAEELQADAYHAVDPSRGAYHKAGAGFLRDRLASLIERHGKLHVRTTGGGTVFDADPDALLGAFVKGGDPLVEVHRGAHRVRALMLAEDRHRAPVEVGQIAHLRWRSQPDRLVEARIVQVEPAASRDLIPKSLTMEAGGDIFMLQQRGGGKQASASYLHVILEPTWVPPGVHGQVTASIQFGAEVRTLGQWLHKRVFDVYSAWRMS
ncbi:MAG: putative peptide zinc metalloprotease protein [Hyphomicrobiaceae bacterium]|jgi:putative peptide zinc metalloprotease protein